jgi:hypothetical protein
MPQIFKKVKISDETFESAGVWDVNNDGVLDIVCGDWWYEGPDFKKKHRIGKLQPEGEYYDDFSTIPLDVNGDGHVDFVSCGWFCKGLYWRENPGSPDKEWPRHVIAEPGNVETARAWDIDGDGILEIVPNMPNSPLFIYKLNMDENGKGAGSFAEYKIHDEAQGHGLGCGDLAGNGRMDIVLRKGWLEAPARPYEEPWKWHPDFDLGSAGVPIIVADVNGDGLADLIVGESHDYGLNWWEQRRDGAKRSWIKHPIDPDNSQYHDMQWVDIDGDGQCELVTGKRYRAHCGNDPGADDPAGIYYFKWNGECFCKQVVDYGLAPVGSGCGIHFATADLTGNGLPDIVAPGKDGLQVFFNG